MLQDTKSLWASCQKYISENVTPEDYDRLFSHVSLQTFKVATKTLVLQVPSSYICEEIENKYLDVMRVAIFNTFGKIRLDWSILLVEEQPGKGKGLIVEGNDETLAPDGSITAAKQNLKVAPGTAATNNLPPIDSQLNPSQTFRTFIEGNSNKLSRSVGLSIAEHPQSTQFNPMFIFGPSGCGKTHLVNAIGNHCRKMYPQKRVLYVSARIFQVQYSNAVMQKQINDFIAFYQTIDMLIVVFTFLFIDMFDTVGTLVGVCTKANMVDEKGNIYRIKDAFMADAIATTIGACLGTSTTTTYVESAAGIAQGGRSGLTAFAVAVCFAVALFFSPLFLSIPSAATAPALIIVGLLMIEPITKIPFDDFSESIPAFVCMVMMPLTYSISNGILLGMITYVLMNIVCGNFKKITSVMYILTVLFILKFIFI